MSIDFSTIYHIEKSDKVFIDTNILIFLFSPDFVFSKEYQVDRYSKVYSLLIENGCELYVNSHVISEFINRCLKIDFEKNFQNKEKTKDFKKDYRISERYKETLVLTYQGLNKFLSINVSQIDDMFSSFDIKTDYKVDLDFNDCIIAKNVIDYNLKLLSDDTDFNCYTGIDLNWYMK